MIGLDTNVLVRYLAQDDKKQAASATRLIETQLSARAPGFVSLVVLVELTWVLQRLYGATAAEIVQTIGDLLATPRFRVQQRDVVQRVAELARADGRGAGFADLLIAQLAFSEGCDTVVSFDRTGIRHAGMTAIA